MNTSILRNIFARPRLVLFGMIGILGLASFYGTSQAAVPEPVVTTQTSGSMVEVLGSNSALIPQTLRVTLTLVNMESSAGNVFDVVIPAQSTGAVLTVITATGSGATFDFSYQFSFGDNTATPDPNYVYRLPFAEGASFTVGQGENGSFSHNDNEQNRRAIDFVMPIGTPIHAIREGLVFDIKEDSTISCGNPSCKSDGNYVKILHSDGSWAEYVHLTVGGATVNIGDEVARGQEIGRSGKTGYVSGAHLHFAVVSNGSSLFPESVSMRFATSSGSPMVLQDGDSYQTEATSSFGGTGPQLLIEDEILSWIGNPNLVYLVEASQDFLNWTPLDSAPVLGATTSSKTVSTALDYRFFRIKETP